MTDTTQPPAETLAEDNADMSWIDIAVIRNGAVICDAAPGWLPFLHGDIHVEDVFASTVDYPTTPGLYRWSGYTVGSWQEGDGCVATGGTFTALTRRAGGDAIPAGMKPWHGGDAAPSDLDRSGLVLREDGQTEAGRDVTIQQWKRPVPRCKWNIVAYTPKPPAGGDANGWDHRYRPLAWGEVILDTDECRRDDGAWVTGICVGQKAPDPAYTSHRVYRRLIAPAGGDAGELAAFGASDAACTLYPGEDQAAERAAFVAGAALALPAPVVEGDAADARRYRYLRDHCSYHQAMTWQQPAEWSIGWEFQQVTPDQAFGSFDRWIDEDIERQLLADAEDTEDADAPAALSEGRSHG